MKYYYDHLAADKQRLYKTILDGIYSLKKDIHLYAHLNETDIHILMESVENDHCECFWWKSDHYSYATSLFKTTIHLDYVDLDTKTIKHRCNTLTSWKCKVTEAVHEREKEMALSTIDKTWLIGNHLASRMIYSDSESIPFDERHSIWGAFKGAGVCEAISKAFVFITDENPSLNINAILVTGYLSEFRSRQKTNKPNHAWNALIDKGFVYHFDLTQQIMRSHIPLLSTSRHLLMKPNEMKDYTLTNNIFPSLFVPPTCSRIRNSETTLV